LKLDYKNFFRKLRVYHVYAGRVVAMVTMVIGYHCYAGRVYYFRFRLFFKGSRELCVTNLLC